MIEKRVTQRDIAQALQLSTQTVSMALRAHKRISESTRSKVEAMARKLGYKADPTLSALANYRTKLAHQRTKWERVALLHDWESKDGWLKHAHYQRLYAALKKETNQRGIELDEHWIGLQGCHRISVLRKVRARGIQSILLAPPSEGASPTPIQIPKNHFHVVTFGPDAVYPDHHVIQFDYYENLRLTWQTLHAKGYKRIGLNYPESLGWRTNHSWLAAYLAEQKLAGIPPESLPPLIQANAAKPDELIKWIQEYQLDALMLPYVDESVQFVKSKLPIKIVSMHKVGHESGVDPNPEHAASAALEILQFEMEHALVRKNNLNLRIHIPGRWID